MRIAIYIAQSECNRFEWEIDQVILCLKKKGIYDSLSDFFLGLQVLQCKFGLEFIKIKKKYKKLKK